MVLGCHKWKRTKGHWLFFKPHFNGCICLTLRGFLLPVWPLFFHWKVRGMDDTSAVELESLTWPYLLAPVSSGLLGPSVHRCCWPAGRGWSRPKGIPVEASHNTERAGRGEPPARADSDLLLLTGRQRGGPYPQHSTRICRCPAKGNQALESKESSAPGPTGCTLQKAIAF